MRRASSAWRASETSSSSQAKRSAIWDTVGVCPKLVAELARRLADRHRSLLEPSGQAHLPDAVAKVAAKLAQDGRRRVGDERPSALEVEPVERLDEPQAGDLDQVLELLGGPAVAQRQGPRQGQEAANQLLLQCRIARLRVAAKQLGLACPCARLPAAAVSAGAGVWWVAMIEEMPLRPFLERGSVKVLVTIARLGQPSVAATLRRQTAPC